MNKPENPSSANKTAAHLVRFEELMAQELHDSVCQGLAGTSLLVNVLRRQAETGQPVKAEDLQKVATFLEQTLDDLRTTVSPDALAGKGLGIALLKFAAETSKNLPCTVRHPETTGPDNPRAALVLYRLTRWSVRHAVKSVEKIFIEMESDDGAFVLSIHDGSTPVFAGLPEKELEFLRQYVQTANVDLFLDPERKRLSARAPRN
jgi:signal transduction histidine kinase